MVHSKDSESTEKRLKLGCASYSFPDWSLSRLLPWLADNRLHYVDIGMPHLSTTDSQLTWNHRAEACRSHSIVPYIATTNDDVLWGEVDEHRPEFNRARLTRFIETASGAGFAAIGIVPRNVPATGTAEAVLQLLASGVGDALREASPSVHACYLELHPKGVLKTLDDAKRLAETADHPAVGFTLDTSLLASMGQDFLNTYDELVRYPLNVHIRDVTDHDIFGIPGRGRIDFRSVIKKLCGSDYSGAMFIELFKTEENYGMPMAAAVEETAELIQTLWLESETGS